MIKLDNISKRFFVRLKGDKSLFLTVLNRKKKSILALNNISLEIKNGSSLGIVGPNGAGKTTLLRIIASIIKPTNGNLSVKGKISPVISLGVGLKEELSGRENIFLYGALLGISKSFIRRNFSRIVSFSGLKEFIDWPLKKYSAGMKIKLAFSILKFVDADILLFDDSFVVGDEQFRRQCFDVFRNFKKLSKTIILVSHDLALINQFCEETVVLNKGKVIFYGTTVEAINAYLDFIPGSAYIRRGSQEIEILSINFLNKFGVLKKQFRSKEYFVMRINLNFKHKITDVEVGIAVHNEIGSPIFGTNSSEQNIKFDSCIGKHTIDLVIPSVPFEKGNYSVTINVHNKQQTIFYDSMNKAFKFEIITSNKQRFFNFDYFWKKIK